MFDEKSEHLVADMVFFLFCFLFFFFKANSGQRHQIYIYILKKKILQDGSFCTTGTTTTYIKNSEKWQFRMYILLTIASGLAQSPLYIQPPMNLKLYSIYMYSFLILSRWNFHPHQKSCANSMQVSKHEIYKKHTEGTYLC